MFDKENKHGYSVLREEEMDETKENKTGVRMGITTQWPSPIEKQFFY